MYTFKRKVSFFGSQAYLDIFMNGGFSGCVIEAMRLYQKAQLISG